MNMAMDWLHRALLSACSAALTVIFAKIRTQGVDSDIATCTRTGLIGIVLAALVVAASKWSGSVAVAETG